ncbi:MAG: hypothetical protein NC548_43280 [Lachnospiraceae bacterium]|nr:hypothetical protein [Lachnospiraceae bacterium]
MAEQVFQAPAALYEIFKVLYFCASVAAQPQAGIASNGLYSNKNSGQDNKKVSISKILS